MGLSYTNITLKGLEQAEVAEYLKRQNRNAFVSPALDNCTVVFEKESDAKSEALIQLAEELSSNFACPAFAVSVVDGDIFLYWLYISGKLDDTYNSLPAYFSDGEPPLPRGGNAGVLCKAFGAETWLDEVQDIFRRAAETAVADDFSEEHLKGEEIHDVLAQALNLPLFSIGTSYYSIGNGFLPDDLNPATLIYCGD